MRTRHFVQRHGDYLDGRGSRSRYGNRRKPSSGRQRGAGDYLECIASVQHGSHHTSPTVASGISAITFIGNG